MSEKKFKKTNHQSTQDAKPYDTLTLNRLDDNNRYLRAHGNHHSLMFDSPSGNKNSGYINHRPYCSVTGFASILQIPYWISKTLRKFEVSGIVRIACDTEFAGVGGYLRLALLGADISGGIAVTPILDKDDFRWQYFSMELELPIGLAEGYDTLSFQIKTEIFNQALTAGVTDGEISSAKIDTGAPFLPTRVKTDSAIFTSGSAATAPNATDNEITASVFSRLTTTDHIGLADHVYMTQSGFSMRIWPPQAVAGRPPGAIGDDEGDIGVGTVRKNYASYFQFRSLDIREVHDEGVE